MFKKKLTAFILALSMLLCSFRVNAADSVLIDPGQMLMAGIDDSELDPFSISPDYSTDTQFIPLIASGEAIAWLLAAFGLMGASALYLDTDKFNSWSNNLVSTFVAFCSGREIVLASQALMWISDAASGKLDKASAVYSEFKEWASSLYKFDSDFNDLQNSSYSLDINSFGVAGVTTNYGSYTKLIPGSGVSYFLNYDSVNGYIRVHAFSLSPKIKFLRRYDASSDWEEYTCSYYSNSSTVNGRTVNFYYSAKPLFQFSYSKLGLTSSDIADYFDNIWPHIPHYKNWAVAVGISAWLQSYPGILPNTDTLSAGSMILTSSSSSSIKKNWETSGSLKDVDIQIGNNSAAESIDIPWQDLLGKCESISAQLAQVSEGLISLDDALASVGAQIVAGQDVIAGDDATTDTDTDTDGSGGNNTDNPPSSKPAAYALDLTKYFPFCIPFDLYEFASILAAEPQTPCFDLPLNLGSLLGTYTIRVDLSPFNGIAALIRLSVLFLFCTSLARATRDIIRA